MKKPPHVHGPIATIRWMVRQAWSDLKSVYYANTPVWRWFKSGALVFLGFCTWAGAAVLLSVRPEWTFLYFLLAYGFLLVLWGPLTHFAIVPGLLRLRRKATHPISRFVSRHGGKLNLTVFFMLVIILATLQPGIMMLEFSPPGADAGEDVSGSVVCTEPEPDIISCEVQDAEGFDHAVLVVDGEDIDTATDPPYELRLDTTTVDATTYRVQLRDADGNTLRTVVRRLPN